MYMRKIITYCIMNYERCIIGIYKGNFNWLKSEALWRYKAWIPECDNRKIFSQRNKACNLAMEQASTNEFSEDFREMLHTLHQILKRKTLPDI